MDKRVGRLKLLVLPRGLRHSEVRWLGPRVQWVVSGVQIALWTHMHEPFTDSAGQWQPYKWRVNWCPLPR